MRLNMVTPFGLLSSGGIVSPYIYIAMQHEF